MTPFEFFRQYRNLSVPLIDGRTIGGIDIHEYRNAKDYFALEPRDDIGQDHEVTDGMAAWGILQCKIKKAGKCVGTQKYDVNFEREVGSGMIRITTDHARYSELGPVFYGKGSPAGIAKALRLCVAFEIIRPEKAAIQNFANKNIGLDCSGFVGNYLRFMGIGDFGPSHKVSAFGLPESARAKSLSEIRSGSVLTWASGGHVALVDKVDQFCRADGSVHAWVCESCGSRADPERPDTDGMNYTEYKFLSVAKDRVFRLVRGIGGRSPVSVYVTNH